MIQNKSSKVAAAALIASLALGPAVGAAGAATHQAAKTELTGLKRPSSESKKPTTTLSIILKDHGVPQREFRILENARIELYNTKSMFVKLKNGRAAARISGFGNPLGDYDLSFYGIDKKNPTAQTTASGAQQGWWYSMSVAVKGPGISVLHQSLLQYSASTPWVMVSQVANGQTVYLTVSKVSKSKTAATASTP